MEELPQNTLDQIKAMAGQIFGRNYESLRIFSYNSYRLFLVERNEIFYSGFNMGAGENAVISILLDLLIAGFGTLLVIDEIELGLHAKAQREFIRVLKQICNNNKCQVICSTHSDIILSSLPTDARFFVQTQNSKTIITKGISAEYAFGKLAGQNTHELDIFVEDEVGKAFIMNLLPFRIRDRLEIYVIGSDQAVLKQVAARYREKKMNFISFLDGDKRSKHAEQIRQVRKHLETRINNEDDFKSTISTLICYLPGDTWPEMTILEYLLKAQNLNSLAERWDMPTEDAISFLEQAIAAGKHNEFFCLAKLLSMDKYSVQNDCIKHFKTQYPDECQAVCDLIDAAIKNL